MKKIVLIAALAPCLAYGIEPSAYTTNVVQHQRGEICVLSDIPKVGDFKLSKGDKKNETELCELDHYEANAVCGKVWSTNPAIEYFKIKKGKTKAQTEQQCSYKSGKTEGLKKVAKYKQSTSCSRSSSILGYYQISRILGIKSVPNSVLRTMEKSFHENIALTKLNAIGGSDKDYKNFSDAEYKALPIMGKTWKGLYNILTGQSSKSRTDLVMTPRRTHSYGALSENPKGEHFYGAPFFYKTSYAKRLQKFLDNSPALRDIKNSRPVSSIVGNEFTSANYQRFQQMIDAANLTVLDVLFGQKDRMGNLHARDYLMFLDKDGELSTKSVRKILKKAEKKDPVFEERIKAAKSGNSESRERAALITIAKDYIKSTTGNDAVVAKKALFKDNDCGLMGNKQWTNTGLIQALSHIDEDTYNQIMELYKFSLSRESRAYFRKQLVMNSAEETEFKENLAFIASNLNKRCHAGRLHTDLNLKSFFRGEEQTTVCGPVLEEIKAAPARPLAPGEVRAKKVYTVRTDQIFNESVVNGERKLSDLSKLGALTTVGDVFKPVQEHTLNQYTIVEAVVVDSNGPLQDFIGQTVYISKRAF